MIILGVTGQPSSGKDTVAEYLSSSGFNHISTGGLIKEEMAEKGIPVDRAHTSAFAIQCRKERGPGYLAEIAANKIKENNFEAICVSGLRNVSEIEVLQKAFGEKFFLVAVEAPLETRYKWALARKRVGDEISFEQFKAEEEVERNGNKDTHQVDAVIAMADKVILNDGAKEELLSKVENLVKTIG